MITQVNYLRKTWGLLLDVLFPRICLNCRKYLEKDQNFICESCFKGIEINKITFRTNPHYPLLAAASYENEALRNLIHTFKYNRFMAIEKPLGEILLSYLKTTDVSLEGFTIMPVPLHPKRYRERGFNQSESLALIVSREYRLPLAKDLLKRVKNTLPQIQVKNRKAREANLKDSFKIMAGSKPKIKSGRFLVVDDVYTSGATIDELVKVLRREGAKEIVALVLAKAG